MHLFAWSIYLLRNYQRVPRWLYNTWYVKVHSRSFRDCDENCLQIWRAADCQLSWEHEWPWIMDHLNSRQPGYKWTLQRYLNDEHQLVRRPTHLHKCKKNKSVHNSWLNKKPAGFGRNDQQFPALLRQPWHAWECLHVCVVQPYILQVCGPWLDGMPLPIEDRIVASFFKVGFAAESFWWQNLKGSVVYIQAKSWSSAVKEYDTLRQKQDHG